jgi:hypothetical protein
MKIAELYTELTVRDNNFKKKIVDTKKLTEAASRSLEVLARTAKVALHLMQKKQPISSTLFLRAWKNRQIASLILWLKITVWQGENRNSFWQTLEIC